MLTTSPLGVHPDRAGHVRASVIEILQRHDGDRYPLDGARSILVPNHMRINGVPVWATQQTPAVMHEVKIDGACAEPFQVTVRLLARALRVGGVPAHNPLLRPGRDRWSTSPTANAGAIVEIPEAEMLPAGKRIDRPFVWLNGTKVFIQDGIVIEQLATGEDVATVSLTLLVRRLVVDDEVPPPAADTRSWWQRLLDRI